MTDYATAYDVEEALPHFRGVRQRDSDDLERTLEAAARDVDRACRGPGDLLDGSPLFDVDALTEYQVETLRWATVVACVWRLAEGEADLLAVSDWMPTGLSFDRRAGRPPGAVVLEVLAGSGLIRRSGTVSPDPAPVPSWPRN